MANSKEKKEKEVLKEKATTEEPKVEEKVKEEIKEEKIEKPVEEVNEVTEDTKVEEPVNIQPVPIQPVYQKPKKNRGLTFIIILFIIMIIGALIIALNNVGILKLDNLTGNKKKAELNYTQTTNKVKEGIYITDVSEIVEEVMPSIVSITSKTLVKSGMYGPSYYGQQQYTTGAGSGIIISKNDDELLILTNHHVIEDAEELSVQFVNGKSVDATVKGSAEGRDIAVIAVKLKELSDETINAIKIATIGDSNTLKVGNGIIAIGNALGYGQSVTTGVVSALNRDVTIDNNTIQMIQIDAAINGGNSGGALLNSKGEVVGINSAKYSSKVTSSSASIEGMGFAIPITDVKDTITSLMNGEEVSNAMIGVEGSMVTEAQAKQNDMPIGFYISKIIEGSGADKSELEIGNIILSIDGKDITKFSDLKNELYKHKKGDKVKLKVAYVEGRKYKEKEIEVTLS